MMPEGLDEVFKKASMLSLYKNIREDQACRVGKVCPSFV